ncbi:hypothetical protein RJ639_016978 [Escallonia herrerae]|uniref:CCHC-type domain-containing protein n=1 Tax=Escallonia herrerae TaxID=1293975 RepID=A0AA88VJ08_9ASTE|nr:hypothetical protein RJ639_016978 [Escallonia herrerae]
MDTIINETKSLQCDDFKELEADELNAYEEAALTLVIKAITTKTIFLKSLQNILLKAWNPSKGMKIRHIQGNTFSVTFNHEWDRKRIMDSRPWSIMNSHLVVRDWPSNCAIDDVPFDYSPFWVRIFGLPPNQMTKNNAEKLDRELEKYERIPNFCFNCGRLGHVQRGCIFPPSPVQIERRNPFGPWLRAEFEGKCPKESEWNPNLLGKAADLKSHLEKASRRSSPQAPADDFFEVATSYSDKPKPHHLSSKHLTPDTPPNLSENPSPFFPNFKPLPSIAQLPNPLFSPLPLQAESEPYLAMTVGAPNKESQPILSGPKRKNHFPQAHNPKKTKIDQDPISPQGPTKKPDQISLYLGTSSNHQTTTKNAHLSRASRLRKIKHLARNNPPNNLKPPLPKPESLSPTSSNPLLSLTREQLPSKTRIFQLTKCLDIVQRSEPTVKCLEREKHIKLELDEQSRREESLWRQKSRILWQTEGDLNTRRKNSIDFLKDDNGKWLSNREEIGDFCVIEDQAWMIRWMQVERGFGVNYDVLNIRR